MLVKVQNGIENSSYKTQKARTNNIKMFGLKSIENSVSFGISKTKIADSFPDLFNKIWLAFINLRQDNAPKVVKKGDIIIGKYNFEPEARIISKDNSVVTLRHGKGNEDFEMDVLDSRLTPPYRLYSIQPLAKEKLLIVSKMNGDYTNSEIVKNENEILKINGYVNEVLNAIKKVKKTKEAK